MERETTRYRERTSWHGLARVLLWGVVVLSCYPILAGWGGSDLPPGARWLLVAGIATAVAAVISVVGGLTVLVQETRLVLHLGSVPLIRKTVPFSEIVSLRAVEYRPLGEFGGWGVRGSGRRRAWTARGNRAVLLELADGAELLVGSDNPQRLAERIKALGGERLGVVGGRGASR